MKVKMEPREAGRAPAKKLGNDSQGHGRSGSGEHEIQNGEWKEDDEDKDEGDSHLETWAEFLKRSRT